MKQCPVCSAELLPKVVKGRTVGLVEIDVCPRCAGLWFDKGEAESVVSDLSEIVKEKKYKGQKRSSMICPICESLLKPARSFNLPYNVRAFSCPGCKGVFFPASEYKQYKRAQEAKMSYFEKFNLPLTKRSFLLTGILIFLSAGLLWGSVFYNRRLENRVRAQKTISKPFISVLAPQTVVVTFTTKDPVRTNILIKAPFLAQPRELSVSSAPKKLHQLKLVDLKSEETYSYQILTVDEEIRTASEFFSFKAP